MRWRNQVARAFRLGYGLWVAGCSLPHLDLGGWAGTVGLGMGWDGMGPFIHTGGRERKGEGGREGWSCGGN